MEIMEVKSEIYQETDYGSVSIANGSETNENNCFVT